jgi:hypothetical protein
MYLDPIIFARSLFGFTEVPTQTPPGDPMSGPREEIYGCGRLGCQPYDQEGISVRRWDQRAQEGISPGRGGNQRQILGEELIGASTRYSR